MKKLLSFFLLIVATSTDALTNQEQGITLQIKSLDRATADTANVKKALNITEKLWLEKSEMALRRLMAQDVKLADRLQNTTLRLELLRTIYYEAKRAGLDPDLVLAVVRVESRFRKYAISSAGARGYMQVMPFWADIVGEPSSDLFNVKTNLRLGCAILRNYLDKEHGNIHRALARYNGSLGLDIYPNLIYASWN